MARVYISPGGDCYQAGNLIIRHATPADDEALQQILRDNPMQGWLRLALERSPSYFAGENLLGRSRAIIGQDAAKDGAFIGMYHTAFLPVFVNGEVVQAGYLGELRINPAYRNSLRILKHGFASIHPLNRPDANTTAIWFTSIASDNDTARRLLEAKHRKLPRYSPVGELQTLAISVRHGKRPKLLRRATQADTQRICNFYNRQAAQYNFAPNLDPSWLSDSAASKGLRIEDFWIFEDAENIEACIAVWDQRPFKQAVVQGYRFPLNHLRPVYNLFATLQGKPLLPKSGCQLESVTLSFFAISSKAEKHTLKILREALYVAGMKNARIGLIGLSAANPLLPVLRISLKPTIYHTCIETVSWMDKESMRLNDSRVQPEISLL
ncbi:MAG: hypothetical protein ABFS39_15835 [Pseudomonadota bacterium]